MIIHGTLTPKNSNIPLSLEIAYLICCELVTKGLLEVSKCNYKNGGKQVYSWKLECDDKHCTLEL